MTMPMNDKTPAQIIDKAAAQLSDSARLQNILRETGVVSIVPRWGLDIAKLAWQSGKDVSMQVAPVVTFTQQPHSRYAHPIIAHYGDARATVWEYDRGWINQTEQDQ